MNQNRQSIPPSSQNLDTTQAPTLEQYQKALKDLEEANKNLRRLDKAKDEFVSIASHELRSPMTVIKGYVSMLLAGEAGETNPEAREILTEIMVAIERQIRLVNDLLNVSRIESGAITIKLRDRVDAQNLAALLVQSFKPVIGQKNIILTIETPSSPLPKVQADTDMSVQILINLVSNALKFTSAGSVTISFEVKGEYLITKVKDTGTGIPKEEQEHLFEKFSPIATKITRISGGTGLGLYISKNLAKLQGGDVWLEGSEVGKGSTFCLSLPLSQTESAKAAMKILPK